MGHEEELLEGGGLIDLTGGKVLCQAILYMAMILCVHQCIASS